MKAPLRVAVIGCGRMGAFTSPELRQRLGPRWLPLNHAEAVRAVEGLSLVALCDPDAQALARARAEHGVAAGYGDHRAMLAAERPDIVTVATRTAERPGILMDCAEAGVRGIHSEKPLSDTLAAALEVQAALTARGVAFTYGTLRRYMPIFDDAAAAIAAGEIGPLHQIVVKFGRAPLLWTHPHAVDLICRFAGDGPVAGVSGLLDVPAGALKGRVLDADPLVEQACIRFADGTIGSIVCGHGLDLELMGERGQLTVHGDGAWRWAIHVAAVSGGKAPRVAPVRPARPPAPAVVALRQLRDAVNGGPPPALGIETVVAQQRLVFACVRSHFEGGRVVDPAVLDPNLRVTGLTSGRYA